MAQITDEQVKTLTDNIMGLRDALEKSGKKNDEIVQRMDDLEKSAGTLQTEFDNLKKSRLAAQIGQRTLRPGQYVSDECAKYLGAYFVINACAKGASQFKGLDTHVRESLIKRSNEYLGIVETKSTLTTSDIPLPTQYASEVVELVWKYGQARQFGTVYPLGAGTVQLPKLKTSPAFGLITQAGTVTEKSPQIDFVTFTAAKWGGMVRYPSEIDADSIVALGQFFARYIAREMAKIEDTVFWVADGSGTYGSRNGLLGTALANNNKIVLASGNTKPSDITLANLRSLRAKVSSAALMTSAYYMNSTMEALLVSFNTSATVTPYVANGPGGPTLDGFPVKWVDVLPVYGTSATVNANQVGFGDPSFHYLGVRAGLEVDISREVYFATDEWALRALERFDAQLMAAAAFAVLALAAS